MAYPPGFRFVPNDEELIMDYLKNKIDDEPLPMDGIVVVDLYAFSPDLLADKYRELGEREWYFFTPRNKKYPNGSRPDRCISSEEGFWKASGADTRIYSSSSYDDENNQLVVGFKKSLVFYKGKPPHGQKTNWLMHEYRFNQPPRNNNNKRDASDNMKLDDYVLCRLYKKRSSWKAEEEEEEEEQQVADHASENTAAAIVQYEGGDNISIQDYDYGHDDNLFLVPNEPQPLLLDHHINGGATTINGDSYSYDELESSFLVPDEPEPFLDIDDFTAPELPLPNYNQQEQAAADHHDYYHQQMENYYSHMIRPTKRPRLC